MKLTSIDEDKLSTLSEGIKKHYAAQRPMAWLIKKMQESVDKAFCDLDLNDKTNFDLAVYEFIENNLLPPAAPKHSIAGNIEGDTYFLYSSEILVYDQPLEMRIPRHEYWFMVNNGIDVLEFASKEQAWLFEEATISDLIESTKETLCNPASDKTAIETATTIYNLLSHLPRPDKRLNTLYPESILTEETLDYISNKITSYFDE